MARKPLPSDLAALHFLLGQVDKFLGAAETFRDKMRMQRSMLVRALEAPETLGEYECFASHLKEEIDKAGAALVYPSKLLDDYLDDAEVDDGDDEGLELVRSPGVLPTWPRCIVNWASRSGHWRRKPIALPGSREKIRRACWHENT